MSVNTCQGQPNFSLIPKQAMRLEINYGAKGNSSPSDILREKTPQNFDKLSETDTNTEKTFPLQCSTSVNV